MATAIIPMYATTVLRTSRDFRLTTVLRKSTRTILMVISRRLPSKTPLTASNAARTNRPPINLVEGIIVTRVMNYRVFNYSNRRNQANLTKCRTIIRVAGDIIALVVDQLRYVKGRTGNNRNISLITATLLRLVRVTRQNAFVNVRPEGRPPTMATRSRTRDVKVRHHRVRQLITQAFLRPMRAVVVSIKRITRSAR